MNLDELLGSLSSDIDRQLEEVSNSVDSILGVSTHDQGEYKFCPECGTRLPADACFCMNCGCNVAEYGNEAEMESEPNLETVPEQTIESPQTGIIFTDTSAISEKYECARSYFQDIIKDFIQKSSEVGMNWLLLDAGEYIETLDGSDFWGDYNELLGKFIEDNGIKVGLDTPVFIIGGGDVIPVPQLENPQYGEQIPTDMAYCFGTTFFSDLWDGDRHISEEYVRNTVSRLPIENGVISGNVDEIAAILSNCLDNRDGIALNNVVMATNVAWTENSVTMSQHLPLLYPDTPDENEIYKGMFMCPKLVASADNGGDVDDKVLEDYKNNIERADMILFNLHGSDSKGSSGFYCESGSSYPESFNIGLLSNSTAKVLNTVACFGARYSGFERNDSMLLSAILGGKVVLYAGSSISVPMIRDENQEYPEGATQYPGSGSEKFMPLYCYYQLCGMPAGKAMMKAKLDYFNTFRFIERDDFSLSTIMMFGLYGNPMLVAKSTPEAIANAEKFELLPKLPQSSKAIVPIRMKRMKCILSSMQIKDAKSLLDQIRSCVDDNLREIHESVQSSSL